MSKSKKSHKPSPMEEITTSGDSDSDSDATEQFTKKFVHTIGKSDQSKVKVTQRKNNQIKNVPKGKSSPAKCSSDESSTTEDDMDVDTDGDEEDDVDEDTYGDSGKLSSDEESNATSDTEEGSDEAQEEETTLEQSYAKLRKELADVPFSDLQQLKEKIGIKAYNNVMFGNAANTESGKKKRFQRANKNRPSELSSKRSVPRFREVIQVKKKLSRDPRFDDLSGEYSDTFFKKSYSFLDDMKQHEKEELMTAHRDEEDPTKKKQIAALLKRMKQQDKLEKESDQKQSWKHEWKKREQQLVKQGKKPFYPKKAEMKKMILAEKFKELKKSGKVDKYMARKRKKVASKDRKLLPSKHLSHS